MNTSEENPRAPIDHQCFQVADWQVDPNSARISRAGATVKLEPKVMAVLIYLAERAGQVVSREELEAAVWAPSIVSYDAVSSTLLKLRKAFADDPKNPQIIETISKKGYRLLAPVHRGSRVPDSASRTTSTRPSREFWWIGATVVLLGMVGAIAFLRPATLGPAGDTQRPQPSIAVLPFENVGNDPAQGYFADGISDDLITDLTKISGLMVISRDSSFAYKGEPVDVPRIAGRLGVRYLLHGSVRRSGGQIRINTQLIDATTGNQLWAERYDGEAQNIFRLQDAITSQIVAALAVKLTSAERERLARKDTDSISAYDAFLRGEERFFRYARTSNREARALFQQAIEIDPQFGRAYAMLGWTHVFDFMNGWSDEPTQSLAMAERFATKALAINSSLPLAYFVRGLVYREQREYVKALVEAEKAVALDANYANGHVLTATLLYYAGRPQEGLERMKMAVQLNPHHPHNYPFHMGQAYFVLKRFPEAIAAFNEGLAANPASERLRVWLAAAYAQSGDIDEARWQIEQVRITNPGVSLAKFRQAFPFKDQADLDLFLDGLRTAGLSGAE